MSDRLKLLRHWLSVELGFKDYSLTPASEDASFRRYFRVLHSDGSDIVMDAPPDKEDCSAYLDISARLLACNVNVPEVKARDLVNGFLLLTDLGTELYLDVLTGRNVNTLYNDAIDALLMMQINANSNGLPVYDETLLMTEMHLFRQWLLGKHLQLELTDSQEQLLDKAFTLLTQSALQQPTVFVHRDYHSRNLFHNERANPGIIDFQDAVAGPLAYDLVSLLKDCYIKWSRAEINNWVHAYYQRASESLAMHLDEQQFMRWFDLMGVQRQLKASGIFARLMHRDGKAGYLKDIPRTLSYIVDLQDDYPELADLTRFIQRHVLSALDNTRASCAQ